MAKGEDSWELSQSYHERWRPEECKRDENITQKRSLCTKGVQKWTVRLLKKQPYKKEQKAVGIQRFITVIWSGGLLPQNFYQIGWLQKHNI